MFWYEFEKISLDHVLRPRPERMACRLNCRGRKIDRCHFPSGLGQAGDFITCTATGNQGRIRTCRLRDELAELRRHTAAIPRRKVLFESLGPEVRNSGV